MLFIMLIYDLYAPAMIMAGALSVTPAHPYVCMSVPTMSAL